MCEKLASMAFRRRVVCHTVPRGCAATNASHSASSERLNQSMRKFGVALLGPTPYLFALPGRVLEVSTGLLITAEEARPVFREPSAGGGALVTKAGSSFRYFWLLVLARPENAHPRWR